MSVAVDASVVVAALTDTGELGGWAEAILRDDQLVSTHLMPVEVTSILRRSALAGDLSQDSAAMAHADLLDLRIALFPYEPFGGRVWELRDNVTAYDAWYVSLAESLGVALATLDVRLSRAAGPRCGFLTPG